MKLVVAVIHDRDHRRTRDALLKAGFKITTIASTGGFLREGNVTMLVGSEDGQVDQLMGILSECSRTREQYVNVSPPEAAPGGTFMTSPVKVQVGGAIAFVMDVEQFARF